MSARGAVRLAATRVTHRGRTVTARLSARIARRGTHVIKAGATDAGGNRQPLQTAGRIRIR